MFAELLTVWKSQRTFARVQADLERTYIHFSRDKNTRRKKRKKQNKNTLNMSQVLNCPQEANPGTKHLSKETWVCHKSKGTERSSSGDY